MNLRKAFGALFVVSFLALSPVHAAHFASKHLPFSNFKVASAPQDHGRFFSDTFVSTSDEAWSYNGTEISSREIYGKYCLKDVADALVTYNADIGTSGYQTPTATNFLDWDGKKIGMHIANRQSARGVCFGFRQDLKLKVCERSGGSTNFDKLKNTLAGGTFFVGASMPIMRVSSMNTYSFVRDDSVIAMIHDYDVTNLKKLLAQMHEELGMKGNVWSNIGAGDPDLFWGFKRHFGRGFRMKHIDIEVQNGFILPTGETLDPDYPSSISMGNEGFAGYFAARVDFGVKHNVRVGLATRFQAYPWHMLSRRVPVGDEHPDFSPVTATISVGKGMTSRFVPYIVFEKFMDGVDVAVSYSYTHHGRDRWDLGENALLKNNRARIDSMLNERSWWVAKHVGIDITCDAKCRMPWLPLDPKVTFRYERPIGGNSVAKSNYLSLGVELKF